MTKYEATRCAWVVSILWLLAIGLAGCGTASPPKVVHEGVLASISHGHYTTTVTFEDGTIISEGSWVSDMSRFHAGRRYQLWEIHSRWSDVPLYGLYSVGSPESTR